MLLNMTESTEPTLSCLRTSFEEYLNSNEVKRGPNPIDFHLPTK